MNTTSNFSLVEFYHLPGLGTKETAAILATGPMTTATHCMLISVKPTSAQETPAAIATLSSPQRTQLTCSTTPTPNMPAT